MPHLRDLNKYALIPSIPAKNEKCDDDTFETGDKSIQEEIPGRRRLRGKTVDPSKSCDYALAWSMYVRGNVVTEHAARLIKHILATCCGKSSTRDGDAELEDDVVQKVRELPANVLPLARVHAILDNMSKANADGARKSKSGKAKGNDEDNEEMEEPEDEDEKALRQSANVNNAMQVTAEMWARDAQPWPAVDTTVPPVQAPETTKTSRKASKRKKEIPSLSNRWHI